MKIFLKLCYTVNFQRKLPLQERCIYCLITSTREVYILELKLLDSERSHWVILSGSRPRFLFGPSEREVDHVFFLTLLWEKSTMFSFWPFWERSRPRFLFDSTSTKEVISSRPTLTLGAVPVSPHAVSLTFGFFLPAGYYKVVSLQLGLYCLIHFSSRVTGWSWLFLDWRTYRSSLLSRILALPKVAWKAYILFLILCVLGC